MTQRDVFLQRPADADRAWIDPAMARIDCDHRPRLGLGAGFGQGWDLSHGDLVVRLGSNTSGKPRATVALQLTPMSSTSVNRRPAPGCSSSVELHAPAVLNPHEVSLEAAERAQPPSLP